MDFVIAKFGRQQVWAIVMIIWFGIGLGGCSSLLLNNNQLTDISQSAWQVRGKLSFSGPDDSVTGYLTWSQRDDAYSIYIAGPFGRGATRLIGDNQSASIQLPGMQQPTVAESAEALMLRYAGWTFPVSHIRYWMMGLASPDYAAEPKYNDQGQLESLEQLGWSIRFSRYQKVGNWSVPGLIKLKRPQYRVTLSIKDWDFAYQAQSPSKLLTNSSGDKRS